MPAYSFEALTAEGRSRKGVLEADSAKAARGLLRAQALVPLKVDAVGEGEHGARGAGRFKRRVFNAIGLGVWTRQLAGLVSSGLPLERALSAEEPFMEDVEVPAWVDDELDDGDGDPLLSPGPQHASDPLSPHPREPAAVVSVVSPAAAFGRASSVASTHNVPAPLSDPLTSTTYVQCLSFAL